MSESFSVFAQTEVLSVKGAKVCCDGRDEFSTHPRVFLLLFKDKVTICPYCSLKYKQTQTVFSE